MLYSLLDGCAKCVKIFNLFFMVVTRIYWSCVPIPLIKKYVIGVYLDLEVLEKIIS